MPASFPKRLTTFLNLLLEKAPADLTEDERRELIRHKNELRTLLKEMGRSLDVLDSTEHNGAT